MWDVFMKTNLDFLKTSKTYESEGVWFELSEKTGFLVARLGGANTQKVKQATAKHFKPYARMIENGLLDAQKEREITLKVFIECCLLDWKGVEIDGEAVPFSKEAALKLLLDLPELADTLSAQAQDSKNYREDLGNS